MSHLLYRIGHFAGRHPWRIVAIWVLITVSAFGLSRAIGGEPDETFRLPGSESQQAADLIEDRFPQQTLFVSNVIFHDEDGISSPAAKQAIDEAVDRLATGDHVVGVGDPFDPASPTVSEDGTTAFAPVAFDKSRLTSAEFDQAEAATEVARDAGVQVEYDAGLGYAKADAEPGSEKLGIAAAVLILSVAFGSLVAVSLPIAVALNAILIGTSVITILSEPFSVPKIATVVALMMGLGVGIDYSLFVLTRHRQHLASGMPLLVAVARANATAGQSVIFAGVTVILAIAGLQVSGIPMMSMMGWASAIMVLVTMLAAVTLLPALLAVVGRRVDSVQIPFVKPRPVDNPASKSGRWAEHVIRHPVAFGSVAAVLLMVLAAPVFSMRLAFPDSGNDGPTTTTRKSFDLIADAYGPGTNGPLSVVLETSDVDDPGALADSVAARLQDADGVASVGAPTLNEGRDLAIIEVIPTTGPQDEATSTLIDRLREDLLPEAVGSEAEVMVTGNTPLTDDVSKRLQDRMPWFLAAVIGLSFVVLMVVFRSVLVPLKAAVLNVLSVGAAYGVVVAVFQWGWLAGLIGVEQEVPIMPLAPMLMFAILFGLSMDYEVFLVSRIREQFLQHGNARLAIVEGVRTTGRVITSAALIMIAVFGAFILSSDLSTKVFGIGLATAVLLDVTLVRMVLVPAGLALLGDRAWWLPGWLDRILPAMDLEGSRHEDDELPEPAMARRSKESVTSSATSR